MTNKEDFFKNYQSSKTPEIRNIKELIDLKKNYSIKIIKKFFPKCKKINILDIACGYGPLLYWAKKLGYDNIYGIDISSEQIKLAKSIGLTNVYVSNASKFPNKIKLRKYDIITIYDLIEHLETKETIKLIENSLKLLNKKGSIIIHTVNALSPFFGLVRYGDLTHKTAFTKDSITQMSYYLTKKVKLSFFEDKIVANSFKGYLRVFIWKIFKFIYKSSLISENGIRDPIVSQNFIIKIENQ